MQQKEMAYPPGMELHGSKWRIKKRVPQDLLKEYPQFYPSPFKYLYTDESGKRKAAEKGWWWIAEIEAEFQRVRETGSPYKINLPDDDADLIIRKIIHSRLNADGEIRASGELADELMLARLPAPDAAVYAYYRPRRAVELLSAARRLDPRRNERNRRGAEGRRSSSSAQEGKPFTKENLDQAVTEDDEAHATHEAAIASG